MSGGQKQRINICRAIYVDADIQIFDDPLSALDAHVGKSVFQNVFLNAIAGKTRILVTHALYLLPQVDYIYTVVDGKIAERGTYAELLAKDGAFSRFAKEFGAKEEQEEEEEEEAIEEEEESRDTEKKPKKAPGNTALMQVEERNTGAVSGSVYKEYLKAGKGSIIIPSLIFSLVFLQGAQVMSSYWLVYWQELCVFILIPCFVRVLMTFSGNGHTPLVSTCVWMSNLPTLLLTHIQMGIYAGLGIAQAIGFFLMGLMFSFLTYYASQELHRVRRIHRCRDLTADSVQTSIKRVMHAPMSFFETTVRIVLVSRHPLTHHHLQPLGRIMNRFSKDIDTIDNMLGDSLRFFFSTLSNITGAIILIAIILPWFLIAVFAISIVYLWAAMFYRASARELKRLGEYN